MKIDNDLITQWEPKIQKMLIDLYNSRPSGIVGFEKEDIAQELRIKIMKAAKSFDETKGIVFNTYLTTALENAKRTLMGIEYRHYSQGKAFQIGNTITLKPGLPSEIGHNAAWTEGMIGGLFTFFIGDKITYPMRNPRGGGIITDVFRSNQAPIGPVVLGAAPEVNIVHTLTVDFPIGATFYSDSYAALVGGTNLFPSSPPNVWNQVIEYSRYSIRVRKMPETISLDDVVVSDEGEKIPSKVLEASLDPTNFENVVETEALITHNNLSEQEQLFLELRLKGFTMDDITEQLEDSAYKVRQILREKFADLADEYEINY